MLRVLMRVGLETPLRATPDKGIARQVVEGACRSMCAWNYNVCNLLVLHRLPVQPKLCPLSHLQAFARINLAAQQVPDSMSS